MSFENKGSIPATVYVTREPDRSGNYICDGTADEVQINAAINHASSLGGGEVRLSRGVFTLTSAINLLSSVSLIGSGYDTLLQHAAVADFDMVVASQQDYVYIGLIRVRGTKNDPTKHCIYIYMSDYCIVEDCWVEHHGDGVKVDHQCIGTIVSNIESSDNLDCGVEVEDDCVETIVSDCNCWDNTNYGLYFSALSTTNIEPNICINCNCWDNGKGLGIISSYNVTITNVSCWHNTAENIGLSNNEDLFFANCHARYNVNDGTHGWYLSGTLKNILIVSCSAIANRDAGFKITATNAGDITYITFVGCTAKNNSQKSAGANSGFEFWKATHIIVSGCIATDDQGTKTQDYGIEESHDDCDYNTYTGNNCIGNQDATHDIYLRGANDLSEKGWNQGRQNKFSKDFGETAVADGGTIAHNLLTTPSVVLLTATVADRTLACTAKAAANFTVAAKVGNTGNPIGGSENVGWVAWI